jgi:hypothetical protein
MITSHDPTGVVHGVIVTRLKADAALTALVAARVYTHVPPNTPFPRVVVEASTLGPSPDGTFRAWEKGLSTQVRASSQAAGSAQVIAIRDRVVALLDGYRVALDPPYRELRIALGPGGAIYTDDEAGVTTYHGPAILEWRVR